MVSTIYAQFQLNFKDRAPFGISKTFIKEQNNLTSQSEQSLGKVNFRIMHSFQRTYVIYITRHSGCKQIQWNPIFRTLDFSNHGTFSLDLLQSNPVIRFFETPNISSHFLPPMEEIYNKFTFDFSNPQESAIQ